MNVRVYVLPDRRAGGWLIIKEAPAEFVPDAVELEVDEETYNEYVEVAVQYGKWNQYWQDLVSAKKRDEAQ